MSGIASNREVGKTFVSKWLRVVKLKKCPTDTDENVLFPSHLIDSVSGRPGVSDLIKDKPGNDFFKRLGMVSGVLI